MKNPLSLIWWNSSMTEEQIKTNNSRYWAWEFKYNNFKPWELN